MAPTADWLIRKGVLADLRAKVVKQSRAASALRQKLFTKKAEDPSVKQRLTAEIREAERLQYELWLKRDAATGYDTKQPEIRLPAALAARADT